MGPKQGTFLVVFALLLFGVVGSGIAVMIMTMPGSGKQQIPGEPMPLTDPTLWADYPVPEFELLRHDGQTVTRGDVVGDGEHFVVMDFFFSNCELICPLMNGNMLIATNQLDGYDVRMVSMSVDPRNDTPEKLRAHAAALGADTSRWSFLTGEPGEVAAIVSALGFAEITEDTNAENIIELPDGSTMSNIVHPNRFLVIDPDGHIVGAYRGTDRDEVQTMIGDLKRALAMRG